MSNPNQGSADRFEAGVVAYQSGLYEEAAAIWADIAARRNDPAAQYNLGLLYEQGQGVEQNSTAAARWYLAAAQQEYRAAQYNLGGLYYRGAGVTRDRRQAAHWWTRAAQAGHPDAQYNLALMLLKGDDLPRNLEQATQWLQLAAARGHPGAVRLLEELKTAHDTATAAKHQTQNDAMRAAGVLSDLAWIRRQDPAHYTVQLTRTETSKAAAQFIRQHRIETVATYYPAPGGYIVIAGIFTEPGTATAAVNRLSDDLRRNRPYPRSFASVQADLPARTP